MNPTLYFVLFLLSCALVLPRPLNTTRDSSQRLNEHHQWNLTQDTKSNEMHLQNKTLHQNTTEFDELNAQNETQYQITTEKQVMDKIRSKVFCILSTCVTHNLGDALQTGDETAGSLVHDPFGIGKRR
ncbi:uncharacterized protein [Lepisosteus oculatus]|uniref:uncharacterized protein isoform X2 n=1 Tax=Lepisosteus oculatus TaxID=7918 RepID=UPI0037244FB2